MYTAVLFISGTTVERKQDHLISMFSVWHCVYSLLFLLFCCGISPLLSSLISFSVYNAYTMQCRVLDSLQMANILLLLNLLCLLSFSHG